MTSVTSNEFLKINTNQRKKLVQAYLNDILSPYYHPAVRKLPCKKNVFNQEIYLVRPKKNYGERVSHLFAVETTAEKSHKEKSWSFSCTKNFSRFSLMLFREKWFFSREQSFECLSFIFFPIFSTLHSSRNYF